MGSEIKLGGTVHGDLFYHIVSFPKLLRAWKEFSKGKRKKKDVALFDFLLERNLLQLEKSLIDATYTPDPYESFYVNDPKRRHIHKASVKDRVVHQTLYRALNFTFDKRFIFDSYSSRKYKGIHAGVKRTELFARKVTANYTKNGWYLKCDIRKFFDSIDHDILKRLIFTHVACSKTRLLVGKIIDSFETASGKGLPLGNVTSQLFANIYMNEFDRYLKHELKVKYYLRYSDDFILISKCKDELVTLLPLMEKFLREKLLLQMHPNKVYLRKIKQGIDVLGYTVLPYRIGLRTATKRRVLKKVRAGVEEPAFASYKGVLSHAKTHSLQKKLEKIHTTTSVVKSPHV